MIKDPTTIAELITRLYNKETILENDLVLNGEQYLEHFHKKYPLEYQGLTFYVSVIYHSGTFNNEHWGRDLYPEVYEWLLSYCTKKIIGEPHSLTFTDLFNDDFKAFVPEIILKYKGESGKNLALGLWAMSELGLLAIDLQSYNQTKLCKILSDALFVKVDRQALLIRFYGDPDRVYFQEDIKIHRKAIQAIIQ